MTTDPLPPSNSAAAGARPALAGVSLPALAPPKRPSHRGRGVLATASVALAAFLALLAVLAVQLRSDPRLMPQRGRVVVVRRIYVTTVRERIIGATATGGTTVSSSSVSAPSATVAAPVSTRAS